MCISYLNFSSISLVKSIIWKGEWGIENDVNTHTFRVRYMKGFTLVWVNDFRSVTTSDKFIDQFHWLIAHLVLFSSIPSIHKPIKNMWYGEDDTVKVQWMRSVVLVLFFFSHQILISGKVKHRILNRSNINYIFTYSESALDLSSIIEFNSNVSIKSQY